MNSCRETIFNILMYGWCRTHTNPSRRQKYERCDRIWTDGTSVAVISKLTELMAGLQKPTTIIKILKSLYSLKLDAPIAKDIFLFKILTFDSGF